MARIKAKTKTKTRSDPRDAIYAAIRSVPHGKVSSYGAIAVLAGLPGRARMVGTILKTSPRSARLPWHRIVGASGRSAFPFGSDAYRLQRARLEREGVEFKRDRIDMHRYAWPPRAVDLDELLWSGR